MTIGRWLLRRGLQLLALTAAGVTVAAAVITLGEYSKTHWTPSGVWVSLFVFTIITFSAVVAQFRRSWRRFTFWLTTVALLGVHVVAYSILLREVPGWRLPWFAAVTLVETPLLCLWLETAGFSSGKQLRARSNRDL
jgi:hypothetical protein